MPRLSNMHPNARSESTSLLGEIKAVFLLVGGFIAALWMIEGVDWLVGGHVDLFAGVRPRDLAGLRGLAGASFVHVDFEHLISNTAAIAVLGGLLAMWSRAEFLRVSLIAGISAGIVAWLLGADNSLHIGASGLIFGYLGYLLSRGWFQRQLWPLVISGLVFWSYGALAWNMFPILADQGISWQLHLGGFIGGVWAARRWRPDQGPAMN